jgi:hypothetical protein
MPTMQKLIKIIKENIEFIIEQIMNNKSTGMKEIINNIVQVA